MAEVVHADIVEQILIRLEVKALIRCKSVCNSWHSLITSTRFINGHLNRSYNNELGSRRILLGNFISRFHRLVGSSNGLACIILDYGFKVLVGNPLTSELRKPVVPRWMYGFSLCYGFGYDSSTDDSKVFVAYSCVGYVSLMKKYNVKESWEMSSLNSLHHERKHNIVHYLH
ncbi:putative F-box domain-containing protein [Helianthus annuus]|nr:putative F-box domain-containing protein [Helianthus annuus]